MALTAPHGSVRALLFDLVAAAFVMTKGGADPAAYSSGPETVSFRVIMIGAQSDPAGTAFAGLGARGARWRGAPLPGHRDVEIVM